MVEFEKMLNGRRVVFESHIVRDRELWTFDIDDEGPSKMFSSKRMAYDSALKKTRRMRSDV